MKMRNICIFVAVIIISTVLSACSEAPPESSAIESFSDEPSIVFTDESSLEPTTGEESESPEEISEELEDETIDTQTNDQYELFTMDSESTFALLDGTFIPINEAVEPIEFEKTVLSDDGYEYDLTARYNLYGSSEHEILVKVRPHEQYREYASITLSVDGISEISFESELFDGAGIVDLDKNDSFIEIVLYDSDIYDGEFIRLYRFDGKDLIEMKNLYGCYGDDKSLEHMIYLDQRGKLVAVNNKIVFTVPHIATGYYQLVDNTLQLQNTNLNLVFGKKFLLSEETRDRYSYDPADSIKIILTDEIPNEKRTIFQIEEDSPFIQYYFESNEEFVLLNYSDGHEELFNGEWYQIQLKDGRRGIIFFGFAG